MRTLVGHIQVSHFIVVCYSPHIQAVVVIGREIAEALARAPACVALTGLGIIRAVFPGLTPRAVERRPYGAEIIVVVTGSFCRFHCFVARGLAPRNDGLAVGRLGGCIPAVAENTVGVSEEELVGLFFDIVGEKQVANAVVIARGLPVFGRTGESVEVGAEGDDVLSPVLD